MDGSNRGIGWFCICHAGIELRSFRGAEKRDRLGLSGVEPQGCCLCELRKRHGRASRPAASRDGNRDSNGIDSIVCSYSPGDALRTFPRWDVEKGLADLDKQANVMIDDLNWWTAALKAARER